MTVAAATTTAAPRSNRYPGPCARCGERVGADLGTLIGPPWQTVCATCLPRPAASTAPAHVAVTLDGAEVVIRLVGRAGDAWEGYRAAVDGCRFDVAARTNRATLALFARVAPRLATCGLPVTVAPEVTAALQALGDRAQGDRAAAAGRAAEAGARLATRGLSLFRYQSTGVDWLAARTAGLLADSPGLGKTAQILLAVPAGCGILVVCPAVAKGVWVREAGKFRPDLKPVALSGRGSFRWPAAGELVSVNYDILPAEAPAPPAGVVLVADEAHYLKSSKAARTERFRALSVAVRAAGGRVYLATGTPLLNRAPELWSLLAAAGLEREAFGSFATYMQLWHAERGRYGIEWGAPSPEVATRLQRVMLGRVKAEVLRDLPPKTREDYTVELGARDRKAIDKLLAASLAALGLDLDVAVERAIAAGGSLPGFEGMSQARAILATAKIPALLALVEELEAQDEPVVVFSAHRAPIDVLGEREGWATITGDTSSDERGRIEAAFQAGQLRGVAATIKAGGTAITLTRASRMIMVDLAWTPSDNEQAEDRIHRIGTGKPVLITRLVADHAVDERVAELLAIKQGTISASVDAARRAGDDVAADDDAQALDAAALALEAASEAARKLLEAAAGATAEQAAAFAAILAEIQAAGCRTADAVRAARAEGEARRRAERRGIAAASATEGAAPRDAQDEREEWAQVALVSLTAANADWASVQNEVGWNKADSSYGATLAAKVETRGLTPTEWRVAVAMCAKYWRQVGRLPAAPAVNTVDSATSNE